MGGATPRNSKQESAAPEVADTIERILSAKGYNTERGRDKQCAETIFLKMGGRKFRVIVREMRADK